MVIFCFSIDLETPIDNDLVLGDGNGQLTATAANTANSNPIASSEIPSLNLQAQMKRLRSQRRVTKIFFIVGVIFIIIALPVTVAATITAGPTFYDKNKHSNDSEDLVVLLRFPYCFVALINPFLYALSNPMVKNRVANLFRILCCCSCKKSDN